MIKTPFTTFSSPLCMKREKRKLNKTNANFYAFLSYLISFSFSFYTKTAIFVRLFAKLPSTLMDRIKLN